MSLFGIGVGEEWGGECDVFVVLPREGRGGFGGVGARWRRRWAGVGGMVVVVHIGRLGPRLSFGIETGGLMGLPGVETLIAECRDGCSLLLQERCIRSKSADSVSNGQ